MRQHLLAGVGVEVAGGLVGEDSAGSLTSARAMATRCCWPPESSVGQVLHAVAQPDALERLGARWRRSLGSRTPA